jgi:rRNA maturation endonuclease Nob1
LNKYQEAYDIIFDELIPMPELNDIDKKRLVVSVNLLQELVDKATPKKVNKYRRHIKLEPTYFCPVCENVVEKEQKYCAECGQRLE